VHGFHEALRNFYFWAVDGEPSVVTLRQRCLRGKPASKPATLGADRGYDTAAFVKQMRDRKVRPHVAQNDSHRRSAVDARTTRHEGYVISQRKRKRVEEVFGWMKTVALQRKTRFLGPDRTGWMFTLAAAAYNLVRMRNLQAATA
jgi:hypothetical protein